MTEPTRFARNVLSAARSRQRAVGSALKKGKRLLEARAKRRLSRAKFILVTGSSGKTTTVGLLSHILSAKFRVSTQVRENSFVNAVDLLRKIKPNTEIAVLEAGTAGPGQLEEMARLMKPHISVVTLVALEHYSAFRSLDAVATEKAAIVRALPQSGLAILNCDDPSVRGMAQDTAARTRLFGTTGGDCRVSELQTLPNGRLILTLECDGERIALSTQFIGEYNWLAVAAAATCALELGIPPATLAERVASFVPELGRMSLHKIEGGPTFILDTTKAPYHSIQLPLTALAAMTAVRKRFILGQISDYAGNPRPKYRDTYSAARTVADEVIYVGQNSRRSMASSDDIASGRFRAFESVQDVAAHLKRTAVEGEVILVKSATSLHLERLWLDWVAEVRCWPNDCGKKIPCVMCGLYRAPFAEHGGKAKRLKRLRSISERLAAMTGMGRRS